VDDRIAHRLEGRLADLVDRQARRWEIDRGAGMPHPGGAVVALDRLPGSGGAEVAERVAAWLDYGLFGATEIERLAEDRALGDRLAAGLGTAGREAIERRVAGLLAGRGADEDFAARLRVAVLVAERGMAVLLGHGAALMADRARALCVLVVAGIAARAARVGTVERLAEEPARARLAERDAARAAYLARHFGGAADDPSRFDLVVNTDTLRVEGASALVVDALRRRFPRE
jgi:cytidylate kinase